jgi:hypothetical protein
MEHPGTWLVRTAAAAAALALSLSSALSAEQPEPPSGAATSPPAKAQLGTVTVEAQRERKEVEREVNQFVGAVALHYLHDPLARWNTPICPLVAGLPREQGEFVLARLSQIASSAKATLAGEHCQANFYVVVTEQPEILIKKWRAHDPRTFNSPDGGGYWRKFRDTPRAVRVWYNAELGSSEGRQVISSDASGLILNLGGTAKVPVNTVSTGSRLTYSAVRSLSSVIVVVDANRLHALNFGQLTDYVGMVGLAEVTQDAEVGPVPTILRLFRTWPDPPQGLSPWDEAFLASLYGVDQTSVMEQSMVKRHMVSTLAPSR